MVLIPEVYSVVRLLLGNWVLFAGVFKLQDLFGFVRIVKGLKIFPAYVGYLLPFFELFAGLAIVLNTLVLPFVSLVLVKHLISVGFIVYFLVKGKKIKNCGCYGTMFPRRLSWWNLVDNGILIGLSVLLIVG